MTQTDRHSIWQIFAIMQWIDSEDAMDILRCDKDIRKAASNAADIICTLENEINSNNNAWESKPFYKEFVKDLPVLVIKIIENGGNKEEWNAGWLYYVFEKYAYEEQQRISENPKHDWEAYALARTNDFFTRQQTYNTV